MTLSSTTGIVANMLVGAPNNGQNGLAIYTQVAAVNPAGCTSPCIQLTRPIQSGTHTGQSVQFFDVGDRNSDTPASFIGQNLNLQWLNGNGTFHSDGIQVQGPMNVICLYQASFGTDQNGVNVDAQAPINKVRIANVDVYLQFVTTYAFTPLLLIDASGGTPPSYEVAYPVYLSNFWAEISPSLGFANFLPGYVGSYGKYQATASNGSNQGSQVTWPAPPIMQVTGAASVGDPPAGHFSTTTGTASGSYSALTNLGNACN
jgi:hypothetical protein